MKAIFLYAFFPFVFYILWGPFAFFFTTRWIVKRLRMRHERSATLARGFLMLMAIFLPVAVTSPGGNIAVVLPWWVAVLGMWFPLETGVEFSIGSFLLAVFVSPVALWIISREVNRQRTAADPER